MNPEEYRQQINALSIGELKKMTISDQNDAQKVLNRVHDLEEGLNQIQRGINLEIEEITRSGGGITPYEELIHTVETLLAGLERLKVQLGTYIQTKTEEKSTGVLQSQSQQPQSQQPQQQSQPRSSPRPERETIGITKEFCPQCGSIIEPEDKFCGSCGQRLCCPNCGSITRQSDTFCNNCGQKLYVL